MEKVGLGFAEMMIHRQRRQISSGGKPDWRRVEMEKESWRFARRFP